MKNDIRLGLDISEAPSGFTQSQALVCFQNLGLFATCCPPSWLKLFQGSHPTYATRHHLSNPPTSAGKTAVRVPQGVPPYCPSVIDFCSEGWGGKGGGKAVGH